MLRGEATNTNFIIFDLTRSGLERMIYRTRGEHANQYTTEAVSPQKRYIEITLMYDSINQLVGCRHWTATLDKIFDRRARFSSIQKKPVQIPKIK